MSSYTAALRSVYFGYRLFTPLVCQGEQKERSCLITCHLSVLSILSTEVEILLLAAFSPTELKALWNLEQLNPASCKAAFAQCYWSLLSVLMDNGIEAAAW